MESDDTFVGEHSPRIAAGSGIRQKDLAVVPGQEYVGYIWLKAADEKSKVSISLATEDGKKRRMPRQQTSRQMNSRALRSA